MYTHIYIHTHVHITKELNSCVRIYILWILPRTWKACRATSCCIQRWRRRRGSGGRVPVGSCLQRIPPCRSLASDVEVFWNKNTSYVLYVHKLRRRPWAGLPVCVWGAHITYIYIYIYTYIYTYIFSFAVAYFTCYEVLRQMQTRRRVLEAWFVQQRRLRIELSCCWTLPNCIFSANALHTYVSVHVTMWDVARRLHHVEPPPRSTIAPLYCADTYVYTCKSLCYN